MARTSDVIKHYPDEALLEEVRRAAELVGKPVLTGADFTKHTGIAASALRRRFGAWRIALERAGLGHMLSEEDEQEKLIPRTTHSDEEMLDEMRRVAGLTNRPLLTMEDFDKHSQITARVVQKRFDGWSKALERAGLERMDYQSVVMYISDCPDEVLLDEIRRVAELVTKPVFTHDDFDEHSSRIRSSRIMKRFGGWRPALERAGLGHRYCYVKGIKRKHSDEELLAEVRRIARIVGKKTLTVSDFRKHSKFSADRAAERFGGWKKLLERAGLERMLCKRLAGSRTPGDVICRIRQFAAETDPTVFTLEKFEIDNRHHHSCHQAPFWGLEERGAGGWAAILTRPHSYVFGRGVAGARPSGGQRCEQAGA